MQACSRCNDAAGFWIMGKHARAARRPWCLSCITAFLDADQVTMLRIEAAALPRRSSARGGDRRRAGRQG